MNKPKKPLLMLVLASLVIFSACSPAATPTPTEVAPEVSAPPENQAGVLISDKNDLFSTAGTCTGCHQNTIDKDGKDISNSELWRGTMMANAMVDPYYRAGVNNEVASFPQYAAVIEDKCNTCHMPMAHFSDAAQGKQGMIFGVGGYTDSENTLHKLAADAVSCTACHQILKDNLGEYISYSGGMIYDLKTPPGERDLFGPYVPQETSVTVMVAGSGFVPIQGEHLFQSEFCATCHNLYTNYVTSDGSLSEDQFPEQTPYSEWLASDFANQKSCQDCHMPVIEEEISISNITPDVLRSPYSKHSFVGGNVYMSQVLKKFGNEIVVQAQDQHFDATSARAEDQLQTGTAEMNLANLSSQDNELGFDVNISIQTGHKFPTSFPSRRVWLHVVVKDANQKIIFDSGSVNENGMITGNDNDADAALFEPHYDEITNPEQVQIYEAIMHNTEGKVTTTLLAASSYIKDNRLLPTGFDKTNVTADIQPYGDAQTDDDFLGGSDTVSYRIDTTNASGPFTVEVELLYQSISYRWAKNSFEFGTEEALLFEKYYNEVPNLPVIVASETIKSK